MNRIRTAALVSTALITLGFAQSAFAQAQPADSEPPPAQPPEAGPITITQSAISSDIVVTGSRLRVAAPVGSTVIALGREDAAAGGAVTTDRLIKQIPQVFDLGVSENSRGQSGGSGNVTYGNSVNLRGIGPYATLILVDGHRVVNNSCSVDPSIIPTLGLERVEVVADGASAIYGSDAVAGVVNLIPRRSLDGVEATGRYGFAHHFSEYQATVTHVGGYTNNAVTPGSQVSSYTPIDLSVSWNLLERDAHGTRGGLTLGAEVRNLFDLDPPYVNLAPSGNGSGGYDASAASPIGREIALSLRASL